MLAIGGSRAGHDISMITGDPNGQAEENQKAADDRGANDATHFQIRKFYVHTAADFGPHPSRGPT